MFRNLPLLLLVVVGGVTSVTGALIGGLFLGLSPTITDLFPTIGGLLNLLIGVRRRAARPQPQRSGGRACSTRAARSSAARPDDTARGGDRPSPATDDEDFEEVTVVGAS